MSSVRRLVTPLALIGLLLLSACGGDGNQDTTVRESGGFPMTIENCGQRTTIDAPPKRVFLIGDNAVPLLPTSALDRVVALVGNPPLEIYDEQLRQRVEDFPRIGSEQAAGSVEVTLEEVIGQTPDLVIGLSQPAAETGVTRDALARAGIPVIELPSFCLDGSQALKNPDFENVYVQVELFGRLFGAEDEAASTVADLRRRVTAVQQSAQGLSGRPAAALFVTPGSSIVYAYGDGSMFDAQLDTLGLTNIFGDIKKRVFEVNLEEVLAKDPEVVMLAYTSGEPEKIKEAFLGIAGIDRVRAVRNDEILVLRFEYTDPPTPLSVEGLEMIAKKFAGAR